MIFLKTILFTIKSKQLRISELIDQSATWSKYQ